MSASEALANPTYETLKASDEAHQMHGFGHPLMQAAPKSLVVFTSGTGAKLQDAAGAQYTDLLGGITVNNLGHGREEVARAAYEQMVRLEVGSNQRNLTTDKAVLVCEKLARLAEGAFPGWFEGARCYLTAGGAEGIEAGEFFWGVFGWG